MLACNFVFFALLHLVFFLKSWLRFKYNPSSLLWLILGKTCQNLICLTSKELENFHAKTCRSVSETYSIARYPINARRFVYRPYNELSHIMNVYIVTVKTIISTGLYRGLTVGRWRSFHETRSRTRGYQAYSEIDHEHNDW